MEPMAERTGFAAAGLATPMIQPEGAEYSIDIQGSDEDVNRAKSVADEINAMPNLTPEQKFNEFQRRFGQHQATP